MAALRNKFFDGGAVAAEYSVKYYVIYGIFTKGGKSKRFSQMRADKRKKLKTAGWIVGDSSDFLGLTPEELAYIDMKISLGNALRARRKKPENKSGSAG